MVKKSWFVVAASVLVPAAAITACGDDDDGGDHSTPVVLEAGSDVFVAKTDANTSGGEGGITDGATADVNRPGSDSGTDSGVDSGTDSGVDSGTDSGVDSGVDSGTDAGQDAGADAGDAGDSGTKPTSVDNATYKITSWTCTGNGQPSVDVLTAADGSGIGEIDFTVDQLTNPLVVSFKGGDCKKTNAIGVTYPQAGQITTTSSAVHSCGGTCSATQCNPLATDPILTDTFDFTKTSTSFTGTRSFPSGKGTTLAGLAGCKEGQTESATYTKK